MGELLNLKQIQELEIVILDAVDFVCKENNLRYFLAGGTLLGAIRHKGFIPWDNDIDISMPRKDYEEFIHIIKNKGFKEDYYKILYGKNFGQDFIPFTKVVDTRTSLIELDKSSKKMLSCQYMFIDIFPIDAYGMEENVAIEKFNHYGRIFSRLKRAYEPFHKVSIKQEITKAFWKIFYFGDRKCKVFNKASAELQMLDFDNSKYIASTFGMRGYREIINKKYFSDVLELEFEGKKYMAPLGYDVYLKQMYGDYMKLPLKKDRVLPHDFDVYWEGEKNS